MITVTIAQISHPIDCGEQIMLLQKEPNQGNISIKGYNPGQINVSGNIYQQTILLNASELKPLDGVVELSDVDVSTLITAVPGDTEILLIGSGDKHRFLPASDIKLINDLGIALEVMGTREACHTFQVLVYENRRVSALLIP